MNKIYEGKAKILFQGEKENEIIIHYKDDATAFNGEKKTQISNKGLINNKITEYIYLHLQKNGIKTHFIKRIDERKQLCKKVKIIPLEVIVRNIAAGSFSKRYGIEEGKKLTQRTLEISYKDDDLGDPLLNDYHAISLELVSREQLDIIYQDVSKINEILIELYESIGIELVDFKAEYGIDEQGEIILADELSPDTSRLWDKKTNKKLDKDRFRRDMGDVVEAYKEIEKRLGVQCGS
ncbi:phosphoribosylaminoimidazolesuccinocarboxamide synthase [Mycoplasma todarodis]|uniref:Phosphoribosylaminoimidazole-succinocarboxamide synthase n=1 Tax=Mycoplasma todarodis TaxID=1937191 RepID=A0A4R0XRP7_9MOLU|nr:phosphoribosylaminoimidazolesuccinocarboxamide synthase [Mycoplasma todarodis]TCG11090.1 phosphoribosylaminoimidazolesuccinocarboxamide synthase [Mycoplasma todarodis]